MFDQAIAEQITERIAQGEPLTHVAKELRIGRQTIHDWRAAVPEFAVQYARAKDAGYDAIADEIMAIADECPADAEDVAAARLRIDSRRWLLAKWDPKRYGDRIQADVDLTVRVQIADPTRQLRQPVQDIAQGARTLPALEHSGPVSALAVGALVQPGDVTQK